MSLLAETSEKKNLIAMLSFSWLLPSQKKQTKKHKKLYLIAVIWNVTQENR